MSFSTSNTSNDNGSINPNTRGKTRKPSGTDTKNGSKKSDRLYASHAGNHLSQILGSMLRGCDYHIRAPGVDAGMGHFGLNINDFVFGKVRPDAAASHTFYASGYVAVNVQLAPNLYGVTSISLKGQYCPDTVPLFRGKTKAKQRPHHLFDSVTYIFDDGSSCSMRWVGKTQRYTVSVIDVDGTPTCVFPDLTRNVCIHCFLGDILKITKPGMFDHLKDDLFVVKVPWDADKTQFVDDPLRVDLYRRKHKFLKKGSDWLAYNDADFLPRGIYPCRCCTHDFGLMPKIAYSVLTGPYSLCKNPVFWNDNLKAQVVHPS